MKKKTIIIAAVVAVLAIGGAAISSNPDMLQGRFTNMTRGGSSFQSPSSTISTSPVSPSSDSIDMEQVEYHFDRVEYLSGQFEDAMGQLDSLVSSFENATNEEYSIDESELDELKAELDLAYAGRLNVSQMAREIESMEDEIDDRSGALPANYLSRAEDYYDEANEDLIEFASLYEESLAIYNSNVGRAGDLEITDVNAFASSTELVLNLDIVNNVNPDVSSETRSVYPGGVLYSGALTAGSQLKTFSGSQNFKTTISGGGSEVFTIYLDDDEVNSWLINKVLSGETIELSLAAEVDAADNIAEHNERNNEFTMTLAL